MSGGKVRDMRESSRHGGSSSLATGEVDVRRKGGGERGEEEGDKGSAGMEGGSGEGKMGVE